jgi:antitoxin component of MazEF toxin-antitoxin module
MRVVIEKRGPSAVVQVPLSVARSAKIEIGDPVDIREERGRIVIEP